MKGMNQDIQYGAQMLKRLDEGFTLRLIQSPVLARKKNGMIQVSAPGYTLRLKPEDFLDLYGGQDALILEDSTGIDEKKDDEYYAWRREKQ